MPTETQQGGEIALQTSEHSATVYRHTLHEGSLPGSGLPLRLPESATGRLVRPFDVVLPVNFAYYQVYPEDTADRPKIANFRHWILAEIDAGKPR